MAAVACAAGLALTAIAPPATATVALRGHSQLVRLYGTRGNPPVIVSSGDGGWMHLGPRVAEWVHTMMLQPSEHDLYFTTDQCQLVFQPFSKMVKVGRLPHDGGTSS